MTNFLSSFAALESCHPRLNFKIHPSLPFPKEGISGFLSALRFPAQLESQPCAFRASGVRRDKAMLCLFLLTLCRNDSIPTFDSFAALESCHPGAAKQNPGSTTKRTD
jgi:hypothetical protein